MLQSLTLQNFRSHKKITVQFHPQITMIIGPNASGKTNILEAIYALSIGKHFRAERETDVISWGDSWAKVTGEITDYKLQILITQKKQLFVNGISRRQIDFCGKLLSVLFWPEDLSLIVGSPSVRREYLNRILVQTDRDYRRALHHYEKALRQRNKLLALIHDGLADRDQLIYWNHVLIETGEYITKKRDEFIRFVNSEQLIVNSKQLTAGGLRQKADCKRLTAEGKELAANRRVFEEMGYRIHYDSSVISEDRLAKYKDEEVAAKATLVGPHRDDMIFLFKKNNHDVNVSTFGSRGEQRLAVLWYKLGELMFLEQIAGRKPILLLDDIFSELDAFHQQNIYTFIQEYQSIVTSADKTILDRFPPSTLAVISLEDV
ncbi:MAG: DNA replication and repair protein RecF [Patescibacteria group bacterium]|nr:DNA replication and repair protein RecF [Patescibacteria group bacterium]